MQAIDFCNWRGVLRIKMLNPKLTSAFICVLLKDARNDPEHVRGQTGSWKV